MSENEELTPAEEKLSDWMAENMTDEELAELEAGDVETTDDKSTQSGATVTEQTTEDAQTAAATNSDDAQFSRQKAELDAKLERISRGKVRVFAESRLVGTTRLHKTQLDAFVKETMELKLDDTDEDDKGKTQLDRYLDNAYKTRWPSVELSETAEVPDLDAEAKDDLGVEENDLEMARLEEMKLEAEGSGWTEEESKLDALACRIQKELKCDYGRAMNLAYIRLKKDKGE